MTKDQETKPLTSEPLSETQHPIRVVTAASLFDGHDAAINIMRRLLQSQGAEVIHLGHDRSVEERRGRATGVGRRIALVVGESDVGLRSSSSLVGSHQLALDG